MFKRNRFLGLQAIFLLLVAIALMIANQQISSFARVRSQLSIVVLPLQAIVDKPIQLYHWLGTSISTQQEVLGENARLRARQLLLEAKLQRLLALERENAQLRELLSSSSHLPGKTLVAQLLAVDADPLSQQIIIDKGERDGVFVGQPVLDAYGVMGQVISVMPFTSQVMLVSDTRSAVPVQNNRTGARSIVSGTGYPDQLNLLYVSVTADINVGDMLVTSGLGGRFPFGYPIGKIVSIQRASTDRFALVIVEPNAHLDESRQVMLIWPSEETINSSSSPVAPPSLAKPVPNNTPSTKDKSAAPKSHGER